eukprot:127609-Chlamydomonas_euryale.AAC.1
MSPCMPARRFLPAPCAQVFRSRIGSLRKALKSRVEFEFAEAPYDASPHPLAASASEEGGVEAGGKSWWQWSDTGPDGRPSRATRYRWAERCGQRSVDRAVWAMRCGQRCVSVGRTCAAPRCAPSGWASGA